MPIPAGGAVVAFIMTMTGDAEEMVCTLGISHDDPIDDDDAELLLGSWQSNILPLQHEDMHLVRCEIHDDDGLVHSAVPASPTAGSIGGAGFPPNTALLVQKRTPTGGRHGRGRMYVPGASSAEVSTAGFLNLPFVSDCNDALESFRSEISAGTLAPVLISSAGVLGSVITSFTMSEKVATQRRRLR